MLVSGINIILDSSVKHISRTACYHLSGIIENGIVLTGNPNPSIIIYKDKIDFGRCVNPELQGHAGRIMFNFYLGYGNVIYHFPEILECGFFNKTIEYKGILAPTSPDNQEIYDILYPRFS